MTRRKRTTDIDRSCRIAVAHVIFGHLLKAVLDEAQPDTDRARALRRAAFGEDGTLFTVCGPLILDGDIEGAAELLRRFAQQVYRE